MKKGRPSTFPLNLNIAVDTLLKREFDVYREMEVMHPIQREFQCDFIPAKHPMLQKNIVWRNYLDSQRLKWKHYLNYVRWSVTIFKNPCCK